MEILAVQNLSFCYPGSTDPAIDGLSLSIDAGDFFLLCGQSGCGKSTFLRQLKPRIAPHGRLEGEIRFEGRPLSEMTERESASKIGFVLQSPDDSIVTDKVWHELAFGLESLGFDSPTIRRRVAEMASFFGIQNWFYRDVSELSGGQKQLLNLASVMVMQPRLLILDEPTGQLDPIAASDFLAALKKINRELGTTILLTEHRLEEALPLATKAAVMERGRLRCTGSVAEVGDFLKAEHHPMVLAMPAAMQIWGSVDSQASCPISVSEGRSFLSDYLSQRKLSPLPESPSRAPAGSDARITLSEVWFRYEKNQPDVLRGVSLTAGSGELLAILGGNGTGKTTTLKLIAGIRAPYRGQIRADGRIGLLPQNPQTLFVQKTVYGDLCDAPDHHRQTKEARAERIAEMIRLCRLSGLENRHPFDLSGGEQQRAALAKILLTDPDILLLDEPTKGLDAEFKAELAAILKKLTAAGVCIVMVSHDIEFCAQYADRCALFFDGSIVTEGRPSEFFAGNSFYTTSANRIARDIIPNAVTTDDVIRAIGGRTGEARIPDALVDRRQEDAEPGVEHESEHESEPGPAKSNVLPLWRRIGAGLSAVGSLGVLLYALKSGRLTEGIGADGLTAPGRDQLCIYGVLIALLLSAAVFVGRRSAPSGKVQTPREGRRLSRRTLAAILPILLLIPLTLWVGVVYIDHKQYYLTAVALLIECMLPFFMVFEGRKPRARELAVIAVLCALGIAGRAAFFMLPEFKPVLAVTIIAGVAFGGETGFLVGAVTMMVSNILFAQGPWTPWQMFATGMIGFLAGILFRKGILRATRASLCSFGAISAIVIYGGIMNPATALIWGSESLNFKMILGYYLTGLPMDCIHAAATVLFLLVLAEPMLEKLERIKGKYGLME